MSTSRDGANRRMFILMDTARLKNMQPLKMCSTKSSGIIKREEKHKREDRREKKTMKKTPGQRNILKRS
jgi:hypothetical protein